MSGFAADWLELRAPADDRARNAALIGALSAHFAGCPAPVVVDLGAGTGATMRALAPHLPPGQHWRLVDDDPDLLARAVAPAGGRVEALAHDLSGDLAPLFESRPDLVTASAFFDLVGTDWIEALVARLAAARVPLYAALSYDGREIWEPAHPDDAAVLRAFHADQRRDKGLGPALGPDAVACLAMRLEAAGYALRIGASDWMLEEPRDARLIAALAEGSAAAVVPVLGDVARGWAACRRGATRVTIGHRDLLALPR